MTLHQDTTTNNICYDEDNQNKVIFGPIIGYIDSVSHIARVVFETKNKIEMTQIETEIQCDVYYELTYHNTHGLHIYLMRIELGDMQTVNINILNDVFIIRNHDDNKKTLAYYLSCDGAYSQGDNYPGYPETENSYMKISHLDKFKYESPWQKLNEDIENNINDHNIIVIHLGDQVYMDEVVKKIINDNITDTSERVKLISESYRVKFNKKWKKNVLSSVSNIMMWDDHEIVDDFKSVAINEDGINITNELARLLIEMYYYYQRMLFRDPDDPTIIYTFKKNESQYIIIDTLVNRNTSLVYPILGESQHDEIRDFINNSSDVKKTYIISPVPIYGKSFVFNRLITLYKRWADNDFSVDKIAQEEREQLIKMITEGIYENKLGDVVLIGGDYHQGNVSIVNRMYKDKIIKFYNVITSPISSQPIKYEFFNVVDNLMFMRYDTNTLIKRLNYIGDYNYFKTYDDKMEMVTYTGDTYEYEYATSTSNIADINEFNNKYRLMGFFDKVFMSPLKSSVIYFSKYIPRLQIYRTKSFNDTVIFEQ
jgi:hypothetical protein